MGCARKFARVFASGHRHSVTSLQSWDYTRYWVNWLATHACLQERLNVTSIFFVALLGAFARDDPRQQ